MIDRITDFFIMLWDWLRFLIVCAVIVFILWLIGHVAPVVWLWTTRVLWGAVITLALVLIIKPSVKYYRYRRTLGGTSKLWRPRGIVYGKDGARYVCSKRDGHSIVYGSSGDGKTQCLVLPALVQVNGNRCDGDVSG